MKKYIYLIVVAIALLPLCAAAATPDSMDIVDTGLRAAAAVTKLQTTAYLWLSIFIFVQFTLTNIGLLKSGADLEAVWAKFLGSLFWFAFCFYVMANGVDFIDKITQQLFKTAGDVAGTGGFSAEYILDWGLNLSAGLLDAIDNAKGGGILAKLDFLPSIFAGVVCFIILGISALIGFKVFLIKIEVTLVMMLSPLSFSFLGLNALKDQGIAPLKALISLAYRIILLGVIVSTMGTVGDHLFSVFKGVSSGSITEIWKPIFAALFAYLLLGYLAFKSNSIASNLASGSTDMGTADVASAAAMGAAAGAALASGGAAAAGAASSASQPMGDFIKQLSAASEVKNASSSGSGGGLLVGQPPKPSLSTKDNGAIGGKAPQPPGGFQASKPGYAPSESEFSPSTEASSESSSGSTAGIGGASSGLEKQVENLVNAMSQPKKDSFGDRLSALNDHVAREQSTVQAHINVNASDH